MQTDLLTALALVLVIEGALLALFPGGMKRLWEMAGDVPQSTLRAGGLGAAVVGVFLVWLIRR